MTVIRQKNLMSDSMTKFRMDKTNMDSDYLSRIAQNIANISPTYSHNVRTGGKIEFVKDTGPVRRDIRVQGFKWTPDSLRNLAKILWAAQRAHSYGMAALRLFSKMPSAEFSPDGLLGGRGYIQSVKDMRSGLGQAVEVLSTFTDTVHDEVNADHWAHSSGEPEVQNIVEDAEQVKSNPESFVEDTFETEGEYDFSNPSPDEMNPSISGDEEDDEETGSGIPEGNDEEGYDSSHQASSLTNISKKKKKDPSAALPGDEKLQGEALTMSENYMRTTIPDSGNYASSISSILKRQEARQASSRQADSSLPVDTLPGPRVDHIGPAAGNEAGHFNDDDVWPSDDPLGEGFSQLNPINEDGNQDGVTGYDNATDGDSTSLKTSANLIAAGGYSWLPGSKNEKNLDYYALGLSAADVDWLKSQSDPDPPKGLQPEKPKHDTKWLWDDTLR